MYDAYMKSGSVRKEDSGAFIRMLQYDTEKLFVDL